MSYENPTSLRTLAFSVLPTPTVIATVDVNDTRLLSVYVKNLDVGIQTVSVTIQTRGMRSADFAERATFEEFTDIPPDTARAIDFDCGVQSELQLTAVASGLGLDVDVMVKPDGGRRP